MLEKIRYLRTGIEWFNESSKDGYIDLREIFQIVDMITGELGINVKIKVKDIPNAETKQI